MYIDRVSFEILSADHAVFFNERQVDFYTDLYARYQEPLDIDFSGSYVPYEKMSEKLFTAIMPHDFQWILFPRTGLLWEGNYASPELFLKNKYSWRCQMMDVRECGFLCDFRAIEIALKLLACDQIQKIMIAHIESCIDGKGFIGSLCISRQKNSFSVVDCMLLFNQGEINEHIKKILFNNKVDSKFVKTVSNDNQEIGFLYSSIENVLKNSGLFQYVLIASCDDKLNSVGLLLLKIGDCDERKQLFSV